MAVSRRKKRQSPRPLVGALAFGNDPEGTPRGSAAFGGADPTTPLRGALRFGNDPQGAPMGARAIGGPDKDQPLRGALLFGNRPDGGPAGARAFGGPDKDQPLRGALLFGNDPKGEPTGALSFGNPTMVAQFRGSKAFGAPQLVPEKLYKDEIGYDFGGVLLMVDEANMAGIRKDPRDRIRSRIVGILQRELDIDVQKIRSGLGEDAIKWGVMRDPDSTLNRALARDLRSWYQKAPGDVLGIAHVRDLLEETERMHSFSLTCAWDRSPVTLTIKWGGEEVAYAETRFHKEHTFFEFKDRDGKLLAYADTIQPAAPEQTARVRGIDAELVAEVVLTSPTRGDDTEKKATPDFGADIRNAAGELLFTLKERRISDETFLAELILPGTEAIIGRIEDRPKDGEISATVELDLPVPQTLAWALAAIFADLARLRRTGWPQPKPEQEEAPESIEQALGPRRPPRRQKPGGR